MAKRIGDYPTCPVCGHEYDSEEAGYLVTYWGEDLPREEECVSCESTFTVKEVVVRRFVTNDEPPEDDAYWWILSPDELAFGEKGYPSKRHEPAYP